MRQKYMISKDNENDALTIKEFAEVDKEMFSLLCEETFDGKMIASAMAEGKENLIAKLRTANLYPPGIYADKIAEAVTQLYASEDTQSTEVFFDDKEILIRNAEEREAQADIEAESAEIDELLEEDADETLEADKAITDIKSPLKIAKDDSSSVEDDA